MTKYELRYAPHSRVCPRVIDHENWGGEVLSAHGAYTEDREIYTPAANIPGNRGMTSRRTHETKSMLCIDVSVSPFFKDSTQRNIDYSRGFSLTGLLGPATPHIVEKAVTAIDRTCHSDLSGAVLDAQWPG